MRSGEKIVFWDEFNPVLFAEEHAMPVPQFLKAFNGDPFEIQVPQNAHDGNVDFQWKHGCVFTAKEKDPFEISERSSVSEEDLNHIKTRVELFRCVGKIAVLRPGGVDKCAVHLAKWVRAGADQFDANSVLSAMAPHHATGEQAVAGLRALLAAAHIHEELARVVHADVVGTGAVDVRELALSDWTSLPSWSRLRPLEQRRLLAAVVR